MPDETRRPAPTVAIPAGRPLSGTVEVPPSKSVTHRLLLLSLLCDRPVGVERPLIAADTERLIEAVERVGRRIERSDEVLHVSPPVERVPSSARSDRVAIDCGASGTLLRMLLGVLATRPGRWVLDGDGQLRRRPIGPLVEALRSLEVEIEWLGEPGVAPVEVQGGPFTGERVAVDAGVSSQFVSALILAGLGSERGLEIEPRNLVSAPYVALTIDCARRFGARIAASGGRWRVEPGVAPPERLRVEGDDSAAAYFAAGAALTGGAVRLEGLRADSVQGDRAFLELLARMGAVIGPDADATVVRGTGALEAIDADMCDMPDQVPTLAALAPFARGTTTIRGVPHLRAKESDRLAAMRSELSRVGAAVEETADGLVIPGVWASGRPPTRPVTVDPHDDHRIAMAMALVGLRREGLTIERPQVVNKSFPDFWVLLGRALGVDLAPAPGTPPDHPRT